jgi:signal transduction histidine kinase
VSGMERTPKQQRLTAAYALAAALVLLAAGILVSAYEDRIFRVQQLREVRAQSDILAASVTAALIFGDAKVVQEHADALKINPEIEAAGVYDNRHLLVGGFAREGTAPLPFSATDRSAMAMDGRTIVTLPVREGGAILGTVHIRAIDEPLERRLMRHAAIMLLAVMAALLVAFLGTSQRTLREANRQLEGRAVALAETNRLLQVEMEERSKAEDALRQSQKMEAVGQLSGGVAHDFNNLLTIIQGNLHLLRTSIDDRPAIQSYVDGASEAAERSAHLVRRLLSFSRSQPLSPACVGLNQLVTGMKDLILHSAGDRVRIEWTLEAKWKVLCDVNQMENVILNLAINARDAMPEGGTLSIETSDRKLPEGALGGEIAPGDYVEMRICDTGTGMTDEVRKRAVDPFFTTKPQGQGTGLGLSMAFAFMRQLNGYLNIETAPGKGTIIVILLPRYTGTGSSEAA